jgi:hypothetical protein
VRCLQILSMCSYIYMRVRYSHSQPVLVSIITHTSLQNRAIPSPYSYVYSVESVYPFSSMIRVSSYFQLRKRLARTRSSNNFLSIHLRVMTFKLGEECIEVTRRNPRYGLDRTSNGVNLVPLKVAAGSLTQWIVSLAV